MTDTDASREQRLTDAFVSLADRLVKAFDVADLYTDLALACVDFLDVTAAGLMLVDAGGRLRLMGASTERARLLELMEIQSDRGPCLDCHRAGAPVLVPDIAAQRARWPEFVDVALRVGYRSAYALPMRVGAQTIGALNVFDEDVDAVTAELLRLGQALADVATVAIIQQRAIQNGEELAAQLQNALNSRVAIEQAKGLLAGRLGLDMPAALHPAARLCTGDPAAALRRGAGPGHRAGSTRPSCPGPWDPRSSGHSALSTVSVQVNNG